MKTINNELIRSFNPCYDPIVIVTDDNEILTVIDWVAKYRNAIKNKNDIIWLLCRNEFLSDKDLRLFAVWCAREAFKLQTSIDQRSIDAVNCAERYANGEATDDELSAARSAAWSAAVFAARSAAESAARTVAWSAADSAAGSAVWSAVWSVTVEKQIDQLLTYFKEETK